MADNTQRFTLAPVVKLEGENNLKIWKLQIKQHLKTFGLWPYASEGVPQPEDEDEQDKWDLQRVQAMSILTASLTKVFQKLENAGWNMDEEEDPKVLYDLVISVIPKQSENSVPSLLYELISLKLSDGTPIEQWNSRLHFLHNRLKQLDCGQTDKGITLIALKGIKERYPQWHGFLQREFDKGTLTWPGLEQEIVKKANEEATTDMLLVSAPKNATRTTTQNTRQPSRQPSSKGNDQGQDTTTSIPKIDCSICRKPHPANWIWDDNCKRHTKNLDTCWTCHPENRPADYRGRHRKLSNTSNGSSIEIDDVNKGASRASLTVSTGLVSIPLLEKDTRPNGFDDFLHHDTVAGDSCATHIVFNDKKWFIDFRELPEPILLGAADGGTAKATGFGTVLLDVGTSSGQNVQWKIGSALYNSDSPINTLSVGTLKSEGVILDPYDDTFKLKGSKTEVCQIKWVKNVPVIKITRIPKNPPDRLPSIKSNRLPNRSDKPTTRPTYSRRLSHSVANKQAPYLMKNWRDNPAKLSKRGQQRLSRILDLQERP